ncbi:hypothetical protein CTA2_10590 [Colletotrichum tanaceti]|uniref:Uncharacterized protein n=1 Tax=Colletotrichum tanaceti TaxID=1306861 RepID=A0A4U6XBH3_9PEZI|nr:hypothetical protein CTA2_10590 [Colletotrichum tanaceti]TKW53051.1 hypothetical protein CTA1_1611 [Colletotrichum tanaceti]
MAQVLHAVVDSNRHDDVQLPGSRPVDSVAGDSFVVVAQTAYFSTMTALLQGVGNFFWVPKANKFGRRPGTNICLVHAIGAYRTVAGEITLAVMCFKSILGFLLSFYTITWVEEAGYENPFGALAGIASAVLVIWVPLFVWGKTIRNEAWN